MAVFAVVIQNKKGEECTIVCHGSQVCREDELNCRDGDKCTISCDGRQARNGAIVTWYIMRLYSNLVCSVLY